MQAAQVKIHGISIREGGRKGRRKEGKEGGRRKGGRTLV